MKRGVVVEYNDDFVTLLTPDGQFLKAKNKEGNYELGEEISFFPLMDKREEAATRTRKNYYSPRMARVGIISAVAMIFFMISFLPFFHNEEAYAYMSIDINPSFEVGVDDQLNVISLEPMNEEANKLLKKVSGWEDKPFHEIVDVIVAECKEDGYVYPGKEIVITTVVNEEDEKVQESLQEDIKKIRTSYEKEQMIVKTIEADQDTREKAQKQGVSTGKYIELTNKEKKPLKQKVITPPKEEEQSSANDQTKQESSSDAPKVKETNQQVKNEMNQNAKEKLEDAKEKLKDNINKRDQNKEQKQKENKQNNGQNKQEKKQRENNDRKDRDDRDKDHDDERRDKSKGQERDRDNNNRGKDRDND